MVLGAHGSDKKRTSTSDSTELCFFLLHLTKYQRLRGTNKEQWANIYFLSGD